jgi:hypothetical protein
MRRSMGSLDTASEDGTARLRSVNVRWMSAKLVILPMPKPGNSPYSAGTLPSFAGV